MKELPRLELTEDPSKANDFIIFRHSLKGTKSKKGEKDEKKKLIKNVKHSYTKKRVYKKYRTKFNEKIDIKID